MPITKPTPKEIVVSRPVPTEKALRIAVSSAGATEWVEREAPEFGVLYPPTKERLGAYLLGVADVWDIYEVEAYLASYGASESEPEPGPSFAELPPGIRLFDHGSSAVEKTLIYDGCVFCLRCGSDSVFDSAWRWNGENWEHRCADQHPQVGYEAVDPIADLKRLREALIRMQDTGKVPPSPLFEEVAGWLRAGGEQAEEVS